MWQNIIVGLLIAMAAYFVIRRLFQQAASKDPACGCGCDGCDVASTCLPDDLKQFDPKDQHKD